MKYIQTNEWKLRESTGNYDTEVENDYSMWWHNQNNCKIIKKCNKYAKNQ